MANREACELYIEQEIKEKLAQGKKPWSIGKELSSWVEKLFEVTINPSTLEKRAERISKQDITTNVVKKSQPVENITEYETPEIIENRKPQGGGERGGAGRPLNPVSNAMQYVFMAISQLDRISEKDPQKNEALLKVINYCNKRIGG